MDTAYIDEKMGLLLSKYVVFLTCNIQDIRSALATDVFAWINVGAWLSSLVRRKIFTTMLQTSWIVGNVL